MSTRSVVIRTCELLGRGWQTLTRYTIELPRRDGTTETIVRDVEEHGNSAAVLPYDPTRKTVLLSRQFRLAAYLNGHDGWLIEACAGMIDPGEMPADAAVREAKEELGVALRAVSEVATIFLSPGASMERATLFRAHYAPADRVADGGGVDAGEDIEVIETTLAEAARWVSEGTIVDAKTMLLVQALLLDVARR